MKFKEYYTESYVDPGIRAYLERRGYRFIAKGQDQSTFLAPDGKILKIWGADEDEDNDQFTPQHLMFKNFYEFCNKRKSNPFLPKFYGWEVFEYNNQKHLQIKMERLLPIPQEIGSELAEIGYYANLPEGDPKKVAYYDKLFKTANFGSTEEGLNHIVIFLGKIKLKLLWDTFIQLSKLRKEHNYGWDMHDANFMWRSNGMPVIVDPFAI